jgi:hypothetical protein
VQSAPSAAVIGLAENGLSFVVFGTVAFSLVMSLLFLVTRGKDSMYDRIGEGGLSRESDFSGAHQGPPPDSPAGRAEREQEIRQMLRARNERMQRRGEAPLDVDAELARLLAAEGGGSKEREHDRGLVEEVRQLVVARNERRERQGLAALDVDAEVARTLAELDP